MVDQVFHFTLGPVQGFVAQARRTRDLWAGSFLLSWLSGYAMKTVLDQQGSIVFPKVTDDSGRPVDPLLRAICGDFGNDGKNRPRIGSLPNRFKAEVSDSFDPSKVESVIQQKWKELADKVYERFIANALKDTEISDRLSEVRDIWECQIDDFWEINWVLGDKPASQGEDDRWLDLRKNWRSHWPRPEGGDHCTVMADYQELSGYIRSKGKKEREAQDRFWAIIRDKAPDDVLDIRPNERLCAIALVKRLFPRLAKFDNELESTIGWVPGHSPEAVGNWPSTTYMAVAPWMASLQQEPDLIKALTTYIEIADDNIGNFAKRMSEQATYLSTLKPLNTKPYRKWHLGDIDGDLLHIHALSNHRTTFLSSDPLDNQGNDKNADKRETLIRALRTLYKVAGKPRSYYAMLLMDGDSLGAMLRTQDQGKVSSALLAFTNKVTEIVDKDAEHGGVTIYAGGDDVFALLPLDTAIPCAQALRRAYGDAFSKEGITNATASCAIVYAHHQAPLRKIIQEAHYQLDNIAKDGNGRDSLVLAVYKPGGVTAQWVSGWEIGNTPVDNMISLIAAMKNNGIPRGFFHKLTDRYQLNSDEDEQVLPVTDDEHLHDLLVMEYQQSRDREGSEQDAQKAVEQLMAVGRPLYRDGPGSDFQKKPLRLDGGLIARFLTQEED